MHVFWMMPNKLCGPKMFIVFTCSMRAEGRHYLSSLLSHSLSSLGINWDLDWLMVGKDITLWHILYSEIIFMCEVSLMKNPAYRRTCVWKWPFPCIAMMGARPWWFFHSCFTYNQGHTVFQCLLGWLIQFVDEEQ